MLAGIPAGRTQGRELLSAERDSRNVPREGRETPWHQARSLQQLLTAAGVDARFEWGKIEISTEMLLNIVRHAGVEDAKPQRAPLRAWRRELRLGCVA